MDRIQDLPIEVLSHILSFVAEPDLAPPDEVEKAKATVRTEEKALAKLQIEEKALAKAEAKNSTEGLEHDDGVDDWEDIDDSEADSDDDRYDNEFEDLRNLCLVSHRFRDLAQPLLFRNFDDDGLDGDIYKAVSFAKVIYRRPELGKYVQFLSLRVPELPGPWNPQPRETTPEDIEFFKGVVQGFGLGDESRAWMKAIEATDPGIFLALMANKTPNLRYLNMPGGQIFMNPLKYLMKRDSSLLSKLESICIECEPEHAGYNIAGFQDFLTLPGVQTLVAENGDLLDEKFPSTWKPRSLSTEIVNLLHCHMDAGALHRFMLACKKVRHFSYASFSLHPDDQRVRPQTTEFNATQGYEGALLHKDTIEKFELEFELNQSRWEVENLAEHINSRPKVGSFREFPALQKIVVQHEMLPAHPQFSPALRSLRITDCYISIRNMVQKIATDTLNGLYPNLTSFIVLAVDVTQPIRLPGQRIPPGQTPEQCFLSLKDMFKGTKVDFEILPYRMPAPEDFDDEDTEDDYDDEDDFDDYDDEFPSMGLGGPGGLGGGPGRGPMPPGLLEMIMERAMMDPDFAHLRPTAGSRPPWEAPGDDEIYD
jgi:hypothetical protein